MSVGTFTQPNHETQGGTAYKIAIDNSIAVMSRLAAAFAPHEQSSPNMTVRVDAGALWVRGALVEVAAQNTNTITAPTTNPRIDRVVIDAMTGSISVIQGTESTNPSPPAIPSNKLPVAQIYLTKTTTAITNQIITDERVMGSGAKEDILVGDLYFTTNNYADSNAVAAAKGYGTWARWGAGRFPVCFNSSDPDFNAGEKIGGSKTTYLGTHTHTIPDHSHSTYNNTGSNWGYTADWYATNNYAVTGPAGSDYTSSNGSATLNVLNPYIVMYAWKRIA